MESIEEILKGVDQYYLNLGNKPARGEDIMKIEVLVDLFKKLDVGQSFIFVNTAGKAKYLYEFMKSNNFPFGVIHSDLTQNEQSDVLKRVQNGECRGLIVTSLMVANIDIQNLSIIFNFDLPGSADRSNYIQRLKHAGRYGQQGQSINIVYQEDVAEMKEIEDFYSTIIHPLPTDFKTK